MIYYIVIEKIWHDGIEASNEEEAIRIALQKFDEIEPDIFIESETNGDDE